MCARVACVSVCVGAGQLRVSRSGPRKCFKNPRTSVGVVVGEGHCLGPQKGSSLREQEHDRPAPLWAGSFLGRVTPGPVLSPKADHHSPARSQQGIWTWSSGSPHPHGIPGCTAGVHSKLCLWGPPRLQAAPPDVGAGTRVTERPPRAEGMGEGEALSWL